MISHQNWFIKIKKHMDSNNKNSRQNLIDGLLVSYDINYVLKNEKKCAFCDYLITAKQIQNNDILCTEFFDFMHKSCVDKNGYEAIFSIEGDLNSMITLKKKTKEIEISKESPSDDLSPLPFI